MARTIDEASPSASTRSSRVQNHIRARILHGELGPGAPLKPQELATSLGVSLSVVREALQQLSGEGLADRHENRGFSVPVLSDSRWQQIAEARRIVEPAMLRLAIGRGDLDWEAEVRAAHHRLDRTPLWVEQHGSAPMISDEWCSMHYEFHRALLKGCGNMVLLETFDRTWRISELARRWSGYLDIVGDHAADHRMLEKAALARDADAAVVILDEHIALTAAALSPDPQPAAS